MTTYSHFCGLLGHLIKFHVIIIDEDVS